MHHVNILFLVVPTNVVRLANFPVWQPAQSARGGPNIHPVTFDCHHRGAAIKAFKITCGINFLGSGMVVVVRAVSN